MNVKEKVFLVTGGGNGIGRELVLELLKKGATVAVIDINKTSLNETEELAKEHSDKISIHLVDITQKAEVESLPEKVIASHGHIDGIINNAGIIQPFLRVNEIDYTSIERVMNVNFYGTLYMTKAFLPFLLDRPEAYIVNVSSMGGFLPVPGQSVYGASKAAVKLLTEGLYAELLNTNIHVSVVFPGATATNITVNSGVEVPNISASSQKFKSLSPAIAAQIIVKGIEQNKPRILVGQDSKFMEFLYRLNPTYATKFIAKKMQSLLS